MLELITEWFLLMCWVVAYMGVVTFHFNAYLKKYGDIHWAQAVLSCFWGILVVVYPLYCFNELFHKRNPDSYMDW